MYQPHNRENRSTTLSMIPEGVRNPETPLDPTLGRIYDVNPIFLM